MSTRPKKNRTAGKVAEKRRMLPGDRLAYSAITERARLKLPDGARMVVWVIVNVEEWDSTQPMPRTVLTPPAGGSPMPDVPNWAWHEYGDRVGFWRFVEVFDEFAIPARARHQRLGDCRLPGDCARRGRAQVGIHRPRFYPAQHAESAGRARRHPPHPRASSPKRPAQPPRGWLGPGLTETWETPDLLAEEGYDYVADWVLDDQPVWLKTRSKAILNVPYTQECNDVAMMLIQHHKASEYSDRALDQFEQIYADAAHSARVMALVVHPYIMGAPHRAEISAAGCFKRFTGAAA